MALPSSAISTARGWSSRKASASSASLRDKTVAIGASPEITDALRPSRAAKGSSFFSKDMMNDTQGGASGRKGLGKVWVPPIEVVIGLAVLPDVGSWL